MIVQSVYIYIYIYTTNTFIFSHFYHRIRQKIYVTLDHKSSLKSLGYICSNSQKYILWAKMIDLTFMPKIIRILSKYNVTWANLICKKELRKLSSDKKAFIWKLIYSAFRWSINLNFQGHIVSFIFITWRRLKKHKNHIIFTFHQFSFMLVIQLSYSDSGMPVRSYYFGLSARERPPASSMNETYSAWECSVLHDVHIVLDMNKTYPKRRDKPFLFSFKFRFTHIGPWKRLL